MRRPPFGPRPCAGCSSARSACVGMIDSVPSWLASWFSPCWQRLVDAMSATRRPQRGGGVMTRVFVLDDHDVVRRGLKSLLEAAGGIEVGGEAGSAVEARSRIPLAEPDVAVLDVRLSDGSGVEICREVRSQHPAIKCVMFSAFDDEVTVVESILAGASGYVLKQIKGGEIVNA